MDRLKIGFWNVENLFDHRRASRHPALAAQIAGELEDWTASTRNKKLTQLGKVVRSLDAHLLGVCEVENEHVLRRLASRGGQTTYQTVGHPSPDKRGIDVCFLYDEDVLDVVEGGFHAIASGYPTRDLVWARFEILQTDLSFIAMVSHWPSRANGPAARTRVGRTLHELIQTLRKTFGASTPILVMGDFNDEPNNASVKNALMARNRSAAWADQSGKTLFNATAGAPDSDTRGTHNYKGAWATLDHIAVSRSLLANSAAIRLDGDSPAIFAPSWVRKSGGRPKRFGRPKIGSDMSGFSDHFAVSVELVY